MILYSKINNLRKAKFRTCTSIEKVDGKLYSVKKVLNKGLNKHYLKMLESNYDYINQNKDQLPFSYTKLSIKNDLAYFNFVEGPTLLSNIINECENFKFKKALTLFEEYVNNIINKLPKGKTKPNKNFENIFGKVSKELETVNTGIIDLNLDNFIVTDDENILIDYEWIVDSPVPKDFIVFKAITGLVNTLQQMNLNTDIFVEKYKDLIINEEFIRMEYAFQKYVLTNTNDYEEFLKNYKNMLTYKPNTSFDIFNKLAHMQEVIDHIEDDRKALRNLVNEQKEILNRNEKILSKKSVKAALKISKMLGR